MQSINIHENKIILKNTLLFTIYIFIPIVFHFISAYLNSYMLEYIMTTILIIMSLVINKSPRNIKKIILILFVV